MKHVLLVEDDPAMSIALGDGLASEGYRVTLAADGESGLELAATASPDLVVLDVMLPLLNGLELCRRLRGQGNGVPILMLTARSQEADKVLGLKVGADDYVTKPFGFLELMARVEALLRRTAIPAAPEPPSLIRFGDVAVDLRRHEVRKGEELLDLSPREFELLVFLLRHRGEIVTREQLLDTVWEYNAIPLTRTVDMHVAKLRKKIEDNPAEPRHLITVHRLGYKLAD